MTCEECLSALKTESLREMTADSAVMQHCATCSDCARVTTMVRDREYETATILNTLPPMSDPLMVAETAGRTAHRRYVGGVVVTLSAIAGAVIIWIVSATMVVPALYRAGVIGSGRSTSASGLRTETMHLYCLSPQQGEDIIRPYINSPGSMISSPSSGISVITVRGTPDEVAKSRNLIHDFERDPNAACRIEETRLRNTLEGVNRAMEKATRDIRPAPSPRSGKAPSLLDPTTGSTLLTPDKATPAPKNK
jgi:hypothetical protein